jgi:hypothetical protein
VLPRWVLWPLFAAVVGFAAGGSVAWSVDQPNYKLQITASDTQTASNPDQHEPAKTLGERFSVIWNRTWEDPVAFYTFILGIFTALLAIVSATQIVFLVRTDKITRVSARAAQQSADALPAIERAYVFLHVNSARHRLKPIETMGPAPRILPVESLNIHFHFINHGKTPAVLTELRAGVKRQADDLPPDAWTQLSTANLSMNVVAGGDTFPKDGYRVADREPITDTDGDAILEGKLFAYFFGRVAYQDVFGTDHVTQFCWRLDRGFFREWGGKQHNYRT